MAATDFSPEEIRQGLKKFRGSMNDLAQKCGRTREWVRLVLKGIYHDQSVLSMASELWVEKMKLHQEGSQVIQTNSRAAFFHYCGLVFFHNDFLKLW